MVGSFYTIAINGFRFTTMDPPPGRDPNRKSHAQPQKDKDRQSKLKAKNIAGAMQIRSSERFSSVSWVDRRGANCEAAVNLADLYRQPTAMIVSRAALLSLAGRCGLHYALGLTLTRLKHMPMFLPWRCIPRAGRTRP
jgi:hypothetical protein